MELSPATHDCVRDNLCSYKDLHRWKIMAKKISDVLPCWRITLFVGRVKLGLKKKTVGGETANRSKIAGSSW